MVKSKACRHPVLQVPSSLVQLEASSEVTLCGEHCWVPGKADSHEHSVGPTGGSKTQQTDDWTSEQVGFGAHTELV